MIFSVQMTPKDPSNPLARLCNQHQSLLQGPKFTHSKYHSHAWHQIPQTFQTLKVWEYQSSQWKQLNDLKRLPGNTNSCRSLACDCFKIKKHLGWHWASQVYSSCHTEVIVMVGGRSAPLPQTPSALPVAKSAWTRLFSSFTLEPTEIVKESNGISWQCCKYWVLWLLVW